MRLLISACLLGCRCRYDGASKTQPWVAALAERYELVPVCPEQLGGLPTPRLPSERQGDRVLTCGDLEIDPAAREVRKGGKLYVFWDVNENSITVAESIMLRPGDLIVFVKVPYSHHEHHSSRFTFSHFFHFL